MFPPEYKGKAHGSACHALSGSGEGWEMTRKSLSFRAFKEDSTMSKSLHEEDLSPTYPSRCFEST